MISFNYLVKKLGCTTLLCVAPCAAADTVQADRTRLTFRDSMAVHESP